MYMYVCMYSCIIHTYMMYVYIQWNFSYKITLFNFVNALLSVPWYP